MNCELAWRVLSDTEHACQWLENEDEPVRRRILWHSAISMLCTISDVLDRDGDKNVRRAVQSARIRWKSEQSTSFNVFYDFIRVERNRLSHEALHGHADDMPIVLVAVTQDYVEDLSNTDDSDVFWPIEHGPFEGLDARDALAKSIQWWKDELRRMGVRRP